MGQTVSDFWNGPLEYDNDGQNYQFDGQSQNFNQGNNNNNFSNKENSVNCKPPNQNNPQDPIHDSHIDIKQVKKFWF